MIYTGGNCNIIIINLNLKFLKLKDNDKLQFGSVSDHQAIDTCLSVLMTFTDVSQWKSLQVSFL